MKKIALLLGLGFFAFACKKHNDGIPATSLYGSWRYTGSFLDSAGKTTQGYDDQIGPDLGDTLRFTKPDTVYYIYMGSTTWSNFHTYGNNLVLVGSAVSDTLQILSFSGTQMQLVLPVNPRYRYRAVYEKFNP